MTVRTLVCQGQLPVASRCLGSFVRNCREPVRWVVHDDGSLHDADLAYLAQVLPDMRVVRRRDADERMADLLARHPTCARFRRENVLGLKLFDTVLFDETAVTRYCDTDVYFFAPFTGLLDLPSGVDALFMRDTSQAYSLRSWWMLRRGVRLVARNNTGLMACRRSAFDLDRLEWFLGLPLNPTFRHFAEQTAWAFLAATVCTHHWLASDIRIVQDGIPLPPGLIAAHYVSSVRGQLDVVVDPVSPSTEPTRRPRTAPAQRLGPLGMAIEEGQRPAWRRVPIMRSHKRDRY